MQVHSADMKEDLGQGTIEKVEALCEEETGFVLSPHYHSRIVLDSGKITEGMYCWWIPVNDDEDSWAKCEINPLEDIRKAVKYLERDPCEKEGIKEK